MNGGSEKLEGLHDICIHIHIGLPSGIKSMFSPSFRSVFQVNYGRLLKFNSLL